MNYSFLRPLARDRAVSTNEFEFIAELVERDRIPDDDERDTLGRILRRFNRHMVSAEIWSELERFRRRMGV